MKKHKLISKMICLLIMLFSISGCWDQEEIEKKAYVIAIGIDKPKNDENGIKVTYLISNPEYGSQQQGGSVEEPPVEIITFTTNDLITARNTANVVIAKQVTYDLLTTMIVSEDFAKDEDFIRFIYDATKGMEIRRGIDFIVSKEQASQFINENKPKLETRPHKYFELILERGIQTGMIPDSDLLKFFRIAEADAELFLAIYGTTEKSDTEKGEEEDEFIAGQFHHEGKTNNTQFAGSAVFKEGKMIGKLTGDETRLSIMLDDTSNASAIIASIPDPFNKKYRIAIRIVKKRNNDVKMDLKNGRPKIDVTVPLNVEVLTDHSMVNYASNEEKREKLKKSIEKRIENKIEKLVKKTQKEFKGEPFGWSLAARKHFLTIPEYTEFDWMKSYPDMKVKVAVEVKLNSFGRQSELPSKQEMRD